MRVVADEAFLKIEKDVQVIDTILNCTFFLILLIIVATFYAKKIHPIQMLEETQRQIGQIEDFFLIGYADEGRRKYRAYPIIKDAEDKLFLAYGKYALLNYNMRAVYINNMLEKITIRRNDGTAIRIGTQVDFYILRKLDIPIIINAKGASISLKGKVYPFLHLNNDFDIERFNEITFFQGAVSGESG